MVSVGVSKFGANAADIRRITSTLQWRSMAHTTVMCFSLNSYCLRRSRETSSCSKTVPQCTAHATQSNFLNGRHPRPAFIAPNLWPSIVQILQDIGRNAVAGIPDKSLLFELKQHLIDVWHGLGQNIINDAIMMSGANICVGVFVPNEDILSICFDLRARIWQL